LKSLLDFEPPLIVVSMIRVIGVFSVQVLLFLDSPVKPGNDKEKKRTIHHYPA